MGRGRGPSIIRMHACTEENGKRRETDLRVTIGSGNEITGEWQQLRGMSLRMLDLIDRSFALKDDIFAYRPSRNFPTDENSKRCVSTTQ